MSFGERLKEARKSKNITQQEFADKLGISINSVANYERGTSFPKEDYLYKIINLLNIDPNYLFQDEIGIKSDLWLEESGLLNKYRNICQRERNIINSIVSIDEERDIIRRLEKRDKTLKDVCISVKEGPYGMFSYADELEKILILKTKNKADFSLLIKGKGMEPVFNNGGVLSVRYSPKLKERQIGVYNVGGYAILATKIQGKLVDVFSRELTKSFSSINPVLLGRIYEYHKME